MAGEDCAHLGEEFLLEAWRVALVLGHVSLPGDSRQATEVVPRTHGANALSYQNLIEVFEYLAHLVGVAATVVPVDRRQDNRAVDVRESFTQLARRIAGLDHVLDDHDTIRGHRELDRACALARDVHGVRIDQPDAVELQRALNEPGTVARAHGDDRSFGGDVLLHEIPEL